MLYYKTKSNKDSVKLISGEDFIDIIFKIGQLNDLLLYTGIRFDNAERE